MEALKHNLSYGAFSRKEGYESAADLKKNEISQLPDKPAEKKFDYEAKKIFDKPDTAKLKNDRTLKDAGDFLQSNPFGVVVVAAYTDIKGDSQQDRLLTEARAMVVRDYLVKNFKVKDARIKTIGLGKSDKVADGGKRGDPGLSGGHRHSANSRFSPAEVIVLDRRSPTDSLHFVMPRQGLLIDRNTLENAK